jgi:CheY-like chemotaxis protein
MIERSGQERPDPMRQSLVLLIRGGPVGVKTTVTEKGPANSKSVHDTPSETHAERGIVLIDGPDGFAVSMTPHAAQQTAERLAASAQEARKQAGVFEGEHAQLPSTTPYALIVVDDAPVLKNACDILADAGFRFFNAEHAGAAIAVLEANSPNITLLFTDVEMPGNMNGFALARHVARQWPEIEIVVASGRRRPTSNEMPTNATFIEKPFSGSVVRHHLQLVLPEGKLPRQLLRPV